MTQAYEMWTGLLFDLLNRREQILIHANTKKIPGHKKNILRKKAKMANDCSLHLSEIFMEYNTSGFETAKNRVQKIMAEWYNRVDQIEALASNKVEYTRGYRRRMRRLANFCSYMIDTITIFFTNLFVEEIVDDLVFA